MGVKSESGGPEAVRQKSPGRVAAAKRLNALGLGGQGGRHPTSARRILLKYLRKGLQGGGDLVGKIFRESVNAMVADLGGPGNVSNMEMLVIKEVVRAVMDQILLTARRDRYARMSLDRQLLLSAAMNRNSAVIFSGVKVLGGPGRRSGKAEGVTTVERFSEPEPVKEPEAATEQ